MQDLGPQLRAAVLRCYRSGAFAPEAAPTPRPPTPCPFIKDKTLYRYESPLKGLAMEWLGLDAFKSHFRHFIKKPYEPLRPAIEQHYAALTKSFDAVLGQEEELASAWYRNALTLPACGLGEEELSAQHRLFEKLPRFPWHGGFFTNRAGLQSAFESKIIRTDAINIFGILGFPQSPWNQNDMMCSYFIGIRYPALWGGMRAWQYATANLAAALQDTAKQMKAELQEDWLAIYLRQLDMIAHVLMKAHFPLFMLTGVALHVSEKNEWPPSLSQDDIGKGLLYSMARGAFTTHSRADDGTPLKFTCPFSGAGIRLLMLDVNEKERAFTAFVKKMENDAAAVQYLSEQQSSMKRHVRRCPKKAINNLITRHPEFQKWSE